MLYTDPVDTTKDCLPSPEDLKYKVSDIYLKSLFRDFMNAFEIVILSLKHGKSRRFNA